MVGSRVYVGGLPFGVRDRDLEKFFKGFGRIRDILIKNGYGFVEFEDYRDADDAVYELNGKELLGESCKVDDGVHGMSARLGVGSANSRSWVCRRVVVEPARGIDRSADRYRRDRYYERDRGRSRYDDYSYRYGPPTRTEYRLVVENLSSRISWQIMSFVCQFYFFFGFNSFSYTTTNGIIVYADQFVLGKSTDTEAAPKGVDGNAHAWTRSRCRCGFLEDNVNAKS
ncbi:hypothetical protein HF086_004253 [Spodoptera exigua]|uniref:RRM domain-containing protein n=1 Tax=Spodoptera exigua TaxID=7107 RepID=A0A922MWE3_SPOEX|nr:hypothetical protein HF086_004253 [Spodoptera exigua]